ncbi:MAG: hypothetical protein RJA25_1238 [Bacteroidota bacterium]|jgi:hypothetical protein
MKNPNKLSITPAFLYSDFDINREREESRIRFALFHFPVQMGKSGNLQFTSGWGTDRTEHRECQLLNF